MSLPTSHLPSQLGRVVRGAIPSQQGGRILQLPPVGERRVCGGVCILHAPVRAHETLRHDGGAACRRRRIRHRRDTAQEKGGFEY